MEFTSSDILRLYGKQIFILPNVPSASEEESLIEEENTPETEPPVKEFGRPDTSFLTNGNPIDWKMKPESKLALILRSDEFSNKELTGILKKAILEAGVDTRQVGFGVLEKESTQWNVTDMPVSAGLMFEESPLEQGIFEVENKKIFFVKKLAQLKDSADEFKALVGNLKKVNTWVSE